MLVAFLRFRHVLVVVIIACYGGRLERFPFDNESGDEVWESTAFGEVVHDGLGAGTAGRTGGDDAMEDAGSKPHPPRKQEEDEEPCDTVEDGFQSPH